MNALTCLLLDLAACRASGRTVTGARYVRTTDGVAFAPGGEPTVRMTLPDAFWLLREGEAVPIATLALVPDIQRELTTAERAWATEALGVRPNPQ